MLEAAALVGVVLSLALVVAFWPDLPAEAEIVALFPLLGLLPYMMLTAVGLAPHAFNLPRDVAEKHRGELQRLGREMITALKALMAWMTAWITWRSIQTALGHASGLGAWFLVAVLGGVAGCTLFYLWRMRRLRGRDHPEPHAPP